MFHYKLFLKKIGHIFEAFLPHRTKNKHFHENNLTQSPAFS